MVMGAGEGRKKKKKKSQVILHLHRVSAGKTAGWPGALYWKRSEEKSIWMWSSWGVGGSHVAQASHWSRLLLLARLWVMSLKKKQEVIWNVTGVQNGEADGVSVAVRGVKWWGGVVRFQLWSFLLWVCPDPRVGVVYLSFSSWVTRLVKRPQSSPIRKSTATPAPIIVRM